MASSKHSMPKNSKPKSTSRDKSQDIRSNSRKGFAITVNCFFLLEILLLAALAVYGIMTDFLPFKYVLVIMIVGVTAIIMHSCFLASNKYKTTLRIISLVLSVLLIIISSAGIYALRVVDNVGNKLEQTEPEVDAVHVEHGKPFIVYISGVDTRGKGQIKEKARSDVNMTVVVNPDTAQILMINTPRDSYLPLYGEKGKEDKLTHAGNKGVECSMKTLSALYGIEYNYYAKVSFYSIVTMVDALGGVTVDSEIAFSSHYNLNEDKTYHFKVGENTLDGNGALAFARERESIKGGDRQRGKNQQIILKAIINKATQLNNITKLNSLVNSVIENTSTNFPENKVDELIKYQLAEFPSWNIQTISVDGKGNSLPCYSTGEQLLSVIELDEESVEYARQAINKVLNGEVFIAETDTEKE